ncbi:MAG: PQQ-dependent sugar dehydrogenase [Patescibacteria group bacterium]|jgi:glucose/arabinose dehydrogenase/plastocyanin
MNTTEKIGVVLGGILVIAVVYFLIKGYKLPASQNTINNQPTQEVAIKLIAQGFTSPVAFVSSNDGTGRMFLVDQVGVIKVVTSTGEVLKDNFLDLHSKLVKLTTNYDERGLLGLAFHPDFKTNGRFFVYYSAPLNKTAPAGWNCTNRVSEFKVSASNPNIADLSSEKIILQIDKPQFNHNGGHIAFGPDGYLYIPTGDGGQGNDVGLGHSASGNGQDLTTLLGKVLRIDIDKGDPYAAPQDNPFIGKDGKDEIFAYGFRNPYHISFDAGGNHELFVADVGQNLWEEVDIVKKGNNYGWNIREGKHCFSAQTPDQSPAECPTTGAKGEPLVDPVFEYGHPGNGGVGIANVGGYVYRGAALAGLTGNYVFADWSKSFTAGDGGVFAALNNKGSWLWRELKISGNSNGRLGLFVKGVGQDDMGELYLLTTEALGPSGTSGKIFKLIPAESNVPNNSINNSTSGMNNKEERVSIKNFAFSPATLTIPVGTKVTWKNEDAMLHTVTSQGNFDSGNLTQGKEFSFTFNTKGTFSYICTLHPFMKGKIVVQ